MQKDWDTKIDTKITAMMKDFETKQAKKLKDLENTFQSKIEHMMVKVMKDFKDSITKVMSSMTAQLERIQTSNLEKISQMIRFPTANSILVMELKPNEVNPSYMVNIIQGQAHHNTFQHTQTSSQQIFPDDEHMKS